MYNVEWPDRYTGRKGYGSSRPNYVQPVLVREGGRGGLNPSTTGHDFRGTFELNFLIICIAEAVRRGPEIGTQKTIFFQCYLWTYDYMLLFFITVHYHKLFKDDEPVTIKCEIKSTRSAVVSEHWDDARIKITIFGQHRNVINDR